jgi:hypothetical protein
MLTLKKVLDLVRKVVDPEYAYKRKEEWTKQIIKQGRKRV